MLFIQKQAMFDPKICYLSKNKQCFTLRVLRLHDSIFIVHRMKKRNLTKIALLFSQGLSNGTPSTMFCNQNIEEKKLHLHSDRQKKNGKAIDAAKGEKTHT